jgi:hypothetical protein
MSNILRPIDLTDHAIRRAVFAMLDGLAHVVPARLQRSATTPSAKATEGRCNDQPERYRGILTERAP